MTARVGTELEGPHKGLKTLVLLSVADITFSTVQAAVSRQNFFSNVDIGHLWLERQPGESYDWREVRDVVERMGLPATLLMMTDGDVPPADLREKLALVWRVPRTCARAAQLASHQQVLTGAFRGYEITVAGLRPLDTEEYEKDEVIDL